MNNDGPPSRPSCAHCPPEPLRTVALSLPHSAHHPTPPHDTAAVRQGQRARGRRRKERERGGARNTQQHRHCPHAHYTTHTACLPPQASARATPRQRKDGTTMPQVEQRNTRRREAQHTRGEHEQTAQRTIRRTRHTRRTLPPTRASATTTSTIAVPSPRCTQRILTPTRKAKTSDIHSAAKVWYSVGGGGTNGTTPHSRSILTSARRASPALARRTGRSHAGRTMAPAAPHAARALLPAIDKSTWPARRPGGRKPTPAGKKRPPHRRDSALPLATRSCRCPAGYM